MNIVTLETERLILRPFNENDLDAFFESTAIKRSISSYPGIPFKQKRKPNIFMKKDMRIQRTIAMQYA